MEGNFKPKEGFIGPVKIKVQDKLTGLFDQIDVTLFATITPDKKIKLFDETGFSLEFKKGCVKVKTKVYLEKPSISEFRRSTEQIVGDVYDIKPEGLRFERPVLLNLPIPSGFSPIDVSIGYWDSELLKWVIVEGRQIMSKDKISVQITHLSKFALLQIGRERLGIRISSITPNPFSPHKRPARIVYRITSPDTVVYVTVKIYNLAGDLVKVIKRREPQIRGVHEVEWDGKTQDATLANNGRYIVHITGKDSTCTKGVMETVVLIK
jgi:hypothetical protein